MKIRELGLILISISIPLSIFSIFVLNYMELFYVSLGILIIGLSSISVEENTVLPYTLRKLMESSILNIEAILEEYDTLGKALFLEKDGRTIAFIPYKEENDYIKIIRYINEIPLRVVNDLGLIIFPPFYEVKRIDRESAESWLSNVLVDYYDLADGVKLLNEEGSLTIRIDKPKGSYLNIPRYKKCLGSLETSIALSALSKYYGKPVKFHEELLSNQGLIVKAEVVQHEKE
jgi:hypothetical protein